MKQSPRSPKSPRSPTGNANGGILSRLEKLRAKHKDVKKSTSAELLKSKERLARERMAKSQELNWYSQRFNESGRTFYMDTSDGGSHTSNSNSFSSKEKIDTKKLPLEKIRERHNDIKKTTGAELARSKERLARERMEQSPVTKKLPLKKLPNSPAKQATVAHPAKSKERLVRERMAQSQDLNWYSQRFNESGRSFFMDASDGHVTTSSNNRKPVAKQLPLDKLPEHKSPTKQATITDQAKSKEGLVRERMAQSQGLNWYSQRFNESGRTFFMDGSHAGGEEGDSSSSMKAVAKKVPLHVALKKENEKLRRKLEKTESDRKLLKKRVSKIVVPTLGTERVILKTKLVETKAQYSNLKIELSETKNELSAKEASTVELMEKMKQMKEAYDTLARQMQSKRGSFSTIPEVVDIEELQAEVKDLKHENKRLLFEKEASMRHGFNARLGSISENHLNGPLYNENETDLSTTTADLTNAEMKVMKAGEEIKDTQDALDHAQSLIEKLKREKQNLAKKMHDQLDRGHKSHLDSMPRSALESNQRPTIDTIQRPIHKGISPSRKKKRALSMVMNDAAVAARIGRDASVGYDLSEVDPSERSLPQELPDNFPDDDDSLPQEALDNFPDNDDVDTKIQPDRRKWKRTASTLNQDLRVLNAQDLNIINQSSIVLTSLFLICGFPLLALTLSVGSILIYGFQKDETVPFNKDSHKYFLINCTGVIMSFGSWSFMAQATEGPSRTLNFVFATLVREFSGFVLAWFIYIDFKSLDEPEELDIVEVKVTIFGGRDLVAKDKNFFGKAKSSDPYVRIYHARNFIGKTQVVWKTLNPSWSRASFTIMAVPSVVETHDEVICHIYDHDTLSADDSMGTVIVPIPPNFNEKVRKWYAVTNGSGDNYCRNATGHLDVEIVVLPRLSNEFKSRLGQRRETFQKPIELLEKKRTASHEGVQSLGEITAETKQVSSSSQEAVVLKI
ncbi:unnamed protein product [Cylindrotheca closterium]|uniref:C2 domain-containing protein n=1 Tax=Cylindrotheca closterium TaxID=2856 RepID=A0AAD2GD22_9STRA|nr:unnamed protein product [Cylindrotheca closterium]